MRTLFVAALFVCLSGPAAAQTTQAQPTPEALSNVYNCAATQDSAARLACYDAAVGRLRTAESEGQIVAVDRARVQTLQRESFGFRLPSLASMLPSFGGGGDGANAEEGFDRMEMQITRISNSGQGRHAFVMSNGQTWVQVEAQAVGNVREGDTITVRRAALGSYMLSPAHGGAAHRIRRQD